MSKKIIFLGGGTGGHIFPAIHLMKYFYNKNYEVLLITDKRGNSFIKDFSEFKSYIINASTPTNKNLFKKFLSYFLIFNSIIRSIFIIKKEKPDLIFGLGGYVSFPTSFASIFFRLPLIIYENNIVMGRANKLLSFFSKKILLSKKIESKISKKFKNKIFEVGSILDQNIINCVPYKKKDYEKKFSILILGGSQGAKPFGEIIPLVAKMIKDSGHEIEINQQCIKEQKDFLTNYYNKNNIKNYVFMFDKNILPLAMNSNLAITRCGASTTAELVHTQTPFIAIPLPNSIDNHQYLNAKYYENRGCCWLLKQDDLNSKNLFNLIIETIKNKNKLEDIRESMKKNQSKNVYIDVENQIRELI